MPRTLVINTLWWRNMCGQSSKQASKVSGRGLASAPSSEFGTYKSPTFGNLCKAAFWSALTRAFDSVNRNDLIRALHFFRYHQIWSTWSLTSIAAPPSNSIIEVRPKPLTPLEVFVKAARQLQFFGVSTLDGSCTDTCQMLFASPWRGTTRRCIQTCCTLPNMG